MHKNYVIPTIKDGYMAAPAYLIIIDRSVFKQTHAERGAAFTAKARHKKELKQAYGDQWGKHLNIPERKLGEPVRMQF